MEQTAAATTHPVVVSISKTAFQRGLKSAHQLHGTYNPANQTWTIPAEWAQYLGPRYPGLVRVAASAGPATYADLLCPHCHTVCYGDCQA